MLNPERIIKNSLKTTRKAPQKVKNGTSVCYNKEKILRRLDQRGGPKDGQENKKNRKKRLKRSSKSSTFLTTNTELTMEISPYHLWLLSW